VRRGVRVARAEKIGGTDIVVGGGGGTDIVEADEKMTVIR